MSVAKLSRFFTVRKTANTTCSNSSVVCVAVVTVVEDVLVVGNVVPRVVLVVGNVVPGCVDVVGSDVVDSSSGSVEVQDAVDVDVEVNGVVSTVMTGSETSFTSTSNVAFKPTASCCSMTSCLTSSVVRSKFSMRFSVTMYTIRLAMSSSDAVWFVPLVSTDSLYKLLELFTELGISIVYSTSRFPGSSVRIRSPSVRAPPTHERAVSTHSSGHCASSTMVASQASCTCALAI
mmetsp:Transcript_20636/g.47322  ORF Transcript_20636/g.47322 Transcript_20636/m.47322 type:complete len:233 (+) Transcript_20636:974-1672(+)